jgi:hypothetical protein
MVRRIAAKHGLDDFFSGLLVGESEAELEAKAAELAKRVKPPKAADTEAGRANGKSDGPALSHRQLSGAPPKDSPAYPFIPAGAVAIPPDQ